MGITRYASSDGILHDMEVVYDHMLTEVEPCIKSGTQRAGSPGDVTHGRDIML